MYIDCVRFHSVKGMGNYFCLSVDGGMIVQIDGKEAVIPVRHITIGLHPEEKEVLIKLLNDMPEDNYTLGFFVDESYSREEMQGIVDVASKHRKRIYGEVANES